MFDGKFTITTTSTITTTTTHTATTTGWFYLRYVINVTTYFLKYSLIFSYSQCICSYSSTSRHLKKMNDIKVSVS